MQDHSSDAALIIDRLKDLAQRHAPHPGTAATAVPGMHLIRLRPGREMCEYCASAITLAVQGHKCVTMGGEQYRYGPGCIFMTGMDLPHETCVFDNSTEAPYLGVRIALDHTLTAQLAAETSLPARGPRPAPHSSAILEADMRLLDAFLRLVLLLETPRDIPVLAPMIQREIHYLILRGPQGRWLRDLCAMGSSSEQVAEAVRWLRAHYREPLHVDELARQVGMSPSSLFRNFRRATAFSPLQFQKTLRLYEARRLMLTDSCGVAVAAYAVGYESPTQFIREYKRLFGVPPHKDISARKKT